MQINNIIGIKIKYKAVASLSLWKKSKINKIENDIKPKLIDDLSDFIKIVIWFKLIKIWFIFK